jgi:hypothetical protein
MKESKMIEDYLGRIDSELFGLDPKAKRTAMDEVKAHLTEKAHELARDRGREKPDERTIHEVIKDFGNPHDIANEYSKEMKIKTPLSMKLILSYCFLIGILDILILVFYFRDAYREMIYDYTDYTYFWGALAIGSIYGFLGLGLWLLSVLQFRNVRRISYMGTITLAVAVFSMVAFIMGGILQQYVEYAWDVDLWTYPNNLILGATALVPIMIFLFSLYVVDRFKKIVEIKEKDPARIIRLRKRSQTLAASTGIVFFILIMIISLGFFDHERDDRSFETAELVNVIQVRDDVRIEIWSGYYQGYGMDNEYRIVYEENGIVMNMSFIPDLTGALEWLSNHSIPGEKVFSWWDYGYSIEGYLEPTIWDPSTIEEWSDDESRIRDVAKGLISVDPSVTTSMMDRYNASYLLTEIRDEYSILYAIVIGAGEDVDDYIHYESGTLTDTGKNIFLHRIWAGDEIPGLEVVYSDLKVTVLKRV